MGKIDNKRPTVISSCRLLSANYYCSSKSPRLALATIFVFAATALMNANFYTCAPAAELLSEDDSSSLTLQNDIDRREEEGILDNDAFPSRRVKRIPQHIVNDCMLVASKQGHYYYKTTRENYDKEGTICGIYLMADPDEIIQINFDYVDMPCTENSIVAFVDGWELNGSYFPSEDDYTRPVAHRFKEYCGRRRVKQILESSQNAALIQYRVPKPGRGFSFYFSSKKNPMPCHVLVESPSYVYTLRNYGKTVNCTLMSMSPAKIKVLSLTVGLDNKRNNLETGTFHDCDKKGMNDYVQIGSGVALGDISMPVDTICGVDSIAGDTVDTVFCDVTMLRLVSSGNSNNQITIGMQKLNQDDDETVSGGVKCPIATLD